MKIISIFILFLLSVHSWAAVIDPTNRIDWVVGQNVGIQSFISRVRTNLIDVTKSPYNADNTGNLDAAPAIMSAISAAGSNDVIYIPDGRYTMTGSISTAKSYITIRGQSTNAILMGSRGGGPLYVVRIGTDLGITLTTNAISSGSTKGSQQITLSSAPSTYMQVGDIVTVTESVFGMVPTNENNPMFPVIQSRQQENILLQECMITNVSGNTLTFSTPLVFNFTNLPVVFDCGVHPTVQVGLENLTITETNTIYNFPAQYTYGVWESVCQNCWISNVVVDYPANYGVNLANNVHTTYEFNSIRHAQSSGNNHSGLLLASDGALLVENSIFADNLQPGIEFNEGISGDAFVGNFFTNNAFSWDIDNHGPHPVMSLFEANVLGGKFDMDGYFGSASHETLFRNAIQHPNTPLQLFRWNTFMQIVGNVLGRAGGTYTAYITQAAGAPDAIIESGYPNIGNGSSIYSSPPVAWNWPGNLYPGNFSGQFTNGAIKQVGTVTTNTLWGGDFTWVPAHVPGLDLITFQDGNITNIYWPHTGFGYTSPTGGTTSNVTLSTTITVSNGWTLYMSFQSTYQQMQLTNLYTHNIQANYDYFNNAILNATNVLPTSLIYTNGAPNYWFIAGTNAIWPPINPTNHSIALIPAQVRYAGLAVSGSSNPSKIKFGNGNKIKLNGTLKVGN